jgi:hypothetical protein
MSIGTPIGTKAEFFLPVAYCCQRDLRQQNNGQERFCNTAISDVLENRFVDFRMEVVLQVGLAVVCDQR